MRMSTTPPANVAGRSKRAPKRLPTATPMNDSKNVVVPMRAAESPMSTRKNANVMPTAKASMDAATESITSSRRSSLADGGAASRPHSSHPSP